MALAGLLAACVPASGQHLPKDALDAAIGNAIGDPSTCVLLADRASGKVVYRYGDAFACDRSLPRCDGPGMLSAQGALAYAGGAGGRMASCPSSADGARTVGWAAGRAGSKRDLAYSAVMEGEQVLPGRIMASRLADAFASAGL